MTELEPIEIHWPEYHSSAMGCGLEDRGIHNRYDAMLHGWECAIERCMEAVPDEPIVLASEVDKALAAKDVEIAAANARLHAIVDAWEALPGGRQVRNSDVERWLGKHMGPGIDAIRGFLRRARPDGITPPRPDALGFAEASNG